MLLFCQAWTCSKKRYKLFQEVAGNISTRIYDIHTHIHVDTDEPILSYDHLLQPSRRVWSRGSGERPECKCEMDFCYSKILKC